MVTLTLRNFISPLLNDQTMPQYYAFDAVNKLEEWNSKLHCHRDSMLYEPRPKPSLMQTYPQNVPHAL